MKQVFLIIGCLLLSACGFHLQGEVQLAPPLHRMYLQTNDPYGSLARDLKQDLKMSNVQLVSSPDQARTILTILKDTNSQSLLSVSATQQTRQYSLITTVEFEISDATGRVLVAPQALAEARTITIQSSQVLGGSNETARIYQQMRRSLAYSIMNRLASDEITQLLLKPSS